MVVIASRKRGTPTADAPVVATALIEKEIAVLEAVATTYRRYVPQVDWSDVELGDISSDGSFMSTYQAFVKELPTPSLALSSSSSSSSSSRLSTSLIANGTFSPHFPTPSPASSTSTNTSCYALKCVKWNQTTMDNKDRLVGAVTNLTIEAEVLARLRHENVIRLHGVCSGGLSDRFSSNFLDSMGYFLVLDCIDETLRERLDRWRKARMRSLLYEVTLPSFDTTTLTSKNTNKETVDTIDSASAVERQGRVARLHVGMMERLRSIGLQVARGLKYLHSKNVVIMDLTPDKIGFEARTGQVKLFNFGGGGINVPTYAENNTIRKGSHRGNMEQDAMRNDFLYLAPETKMGIGSDADADAYSFGMLLWELCTLWRPYDDFQSTYPQDKNDKKDVFYEKIVKGTSWRPTLTELLMPSVLLRDLIGKCWDSDPLFRPSFSRISKRIFEILQEKNPITAADSAISNVIPTGGDIINSALIRNKRKEDLPDNVSDEVPARTKKSAKKNGPNNPILDIQNSNSFSMTEQSVQLPSTSPSSNGTDSLPSACYVINHHGADSNNPIIVATDEKGIIMASEFIFDDQDTTTSFMGKRKAMLTAPVDENFPNRTKKSTSPYGNNDASIIMKNSRNIFRIPNRFSKETRDDQTGWRQVPTAPTTSTSCSFSLATSCCHIGFDAQRWTTTNETVVTPDPVLAARATDSYSVRTNHDDDEDKFWIGLKSSLRTGHRSVHPLPFERKQQQEQQQHVKNNNTTWLPQERNIMNMPYSSHGTHSLGRYQNIIDVTGYQS